MSTLLFFDFDGVLNPIPYRREWVGPEGDFNPYGLEVLKGSNWTVVELSIDPDIYFAPDRTQEITVEDEYGGKPRTYIVRWSSELMERINALVGSGAADFRWLTTWRENARSLLAPAIGLDPSWESVPWSQRMSDYDQQGKRWAIEDMLAAGETRPFVWVDDVATKGTATFNPSPQDYYTSSDCPEEDKPLVLRAANPKLIIRTSTYFGVSRAHWDAIEKFVQDNA